MSKATEWWVGVPGDLRRALDGIAPARVDVITEAAFHEPDVSRWIGITPPPSGAFVFTLHAPIEATGRAEWREYREGRHVAPDCELMAARVER